MAKAERTAELRKFIILNVAEHPDDIAGLAGREFGLSRQAVNSHLRRLVAEGVLEAAGRTRGRTYTLKTIVDSAFSIEITPTTQEHIEWRDKVLPLVIDVPDNVRHICQYGFSEIFNNVIDHSESDTCIININRNAAKISMMICDFGVGIFTKVQRALGLEDPRHALIELAKGKFTTDPSKHSGEGIFFTSRMFDKFTIMSGGFTFLSEKSDDDWLLDMEDVQGNPKGTVVFMEISPFAEHTIRETFRRYEDDDAGFMRTHVPLKLAKYEGEQLMSRSQARRLLTRVNRFSEAMLDFSGVQQIGQAFADEIFRVYQAENPEIRIIPVRMSPEVERMVRHVLRRADEGQQEFEFNGDGRRGQAK